MNSTNLMDVLTEAQIRFPLDAADKSAALGELVALLAERKRIDNADAVLEAVLDREAIMTTGVGNGVAIPHCKTAHSREFTIALGIAPTGIDFESLDDHPATIIFLLVGPDNDPGTHIRLLSRISRIISDETVRERILAAGDAAAIVAILREKEASVLEMIS